MADERDAADDPDAALEEGGVLGLAVLEHAAVAMVATASTAAATNCVRKRLIALTFAGQFVLK
jgi:hypothetical protein